MRFMVIVFILMNLGQVFASDISLFPEKTDECSYSIRRDPVCDCEELVNPKGSHTFKITEKKLDDKREAVHIMQYPYSAIVHIQSKFFGNGNLVIKVGTGFIVDSSNGIILTSLYNLILGDKEEFPKEIKYFIGLREIFSLQEQKKEVVTQYYGKISGFSYPEGWNKNEAYAVLYMANSKESFPYLCPSYYNKKSHKSALISGYPAFNNDGIFSRNFHQYRQAGEISFKEDKFIQHNIQTSQGQGGAPILFIERGQNVRFIGIHVKEGLGIPMTPNIINNINLLAGYLHTHESLVGKEFSKHEIKSKDQKKVIGQAIFLENSRRNDEMIDLNFIPIWSRGHLGSGRNEDLAPGGLLRAIKCDSEGNILYDETSRPLLSEKLKYDPERGMSYY